MLNRMITAWLFVAYSTYHTRSRVGHHNLCSEKEIVLPGLPKGHTMRTKRGSECSSRKRFGSDGTALWELLWSRLFLAGSAKLMKHHHHRRW